MEAGPKLIRTKNFVADAAAFILEHARKALEERNEFRIALSGGNTPAPVYARVATEARDFPWEHERLRERRSNRSSFGGQHLALKRAVRARRHSKSPAPAGRNTNSRYNV